VSGLADGMRALFPGAERQVYLDVAARGLVSAPVRDAVRAYLDECVEGTSDKDRLRREVDETRAEFARLIGAEPEEIGITKNVSEGLNLFVASLEWAAGDNVVVCPELEHPNNIYLWYNLVRRYGVEVRAIPPEPGGRMPVAAMVEAMDERTRVVTFPTISFAPGFVTETAPLVRAAQAVGALTLADGAQSIGARMTDVHALGFDALAVSTQKCLFGLYGFGFLYVRRAVAEGLLPVHLARYGVDLGGAHETAYAEGELVYQPGARRFDLGNYNYLGMTAARTSLAMLDRVGVERIEAHVRALAARLAEGLIALGLPVVGGWPGEHLAHIVSVGSIGSGRHYTADDPAMNALHVHLSEHGVRHSLRSGVLRFAVAAYNDDGDIDRVLELAGTWVGEATRQMPDQAAL
jgi:cysteine desulfurase/selenocysteine lyase